MVMIDPGANIITLLYRLVADCLEQVLVVYNDKRRVKASHVMMQVVTAVRRCIATLLQALAQSCACVAAYGNDVHVR